MRDDPITYASSIETLIKVFVLIMPARVYCAHCIRCLREPLAKVNKTRDYAIVLKLSFHAPVRMFPHSEYTMLLAGVATWHHVRLRIPPIAQNRPRL